MRSDTGVVLEAADIRAAQWRHIANGRSVLNDDVVDELFDCDPVEAASIAEEQEAAIAALRESIPPRGIRYGFETLALTAMCIWEAALEVARIQGTDEDYSLHYWLADGEGAWAARQGCWRLAGLAEYAWESIVREGEDPPAGFDAFDWDFIPAWLDQLHDFCRDAGISVNEVDDETAEAVAQVIAKL